MYTILGEITGNLNIKKKREGLSVGFNWAIAVIWLQSQLTLLEQHSEGTASPGLEQKQAGEERKSGKEGVEYKGRQNKGALGLVANLQPRQGAPVPSKNPCLRC